MEYISCPEIAKKWAFLKDEYKNYAKMGAFRGQRNLAVYG